MRAARAVALYVGAVVLAAAVGYGLARAVWK